MAKRTRIHTTAQATKAARVAHKATKPTPEQDAAFDAMLAGALADDRNGQDLPGEGDPDGDD